MSAPGDSRVTRGGQRPPPYAPPHKVFFGVGAPELPPPGALRPLPAPTVLLINGGRGSRGGPQWGRGCPDLDPPPQFWGAQIGAEQRGPDTFPPPGPPPMPPLLPCPKAKPWRCRPRAPRGFSGQRSGCSTWGAKGDVGARRCWGVLEGLSPRSERLLHGCGVRVVAWWELSPWDPTRCLRA